MRDLPPHYSDAETQIKWFLEDDNAPTGTYHFCVFGWGKPGEGDQAALVYWTENNEIVLWEAHNDPRDHALSQARRDWHRSHDVCWKHRDCYGSTYMLSPAWWHGWLADCRRVGTNYTIHFHHPTGPNATNPQLGLRYK